MPGIMHDPEVVAYEECILYEEQPPARATHLRFWHTLVEYLRRYRTHRLQSMLFFSHGSLYPIETPADLLARQYPTLYIRVFTGI
jgi:hypothetical protein